MRRAGLRTVLQLPHDEQWSSATGRYEDSYTAPPIFFVHRSKPLENMNISQPRRCFLFISSNPTGWGGSEELWGRAAVALAEAGHTVSVLKPFLDERLPVMRRLRALGCRVRDLTGGRLLYRYRRIRRAAFPLIKMRRLLDTHLALTFGRPDLVIISQGGNFDGWRSALACRRRKIPYVLISQKAAEEYWPSDPHRSFIREAHTAAVASYFVSDHNRRVTEEQIGASLPRAAVVRNPFLVPWEPRADWPSAGGGLRLACVGRLYPAQKGQDLLIRLLARDKWRNRALSVTFFGSGVFRRGLEEMAAYHGLTSVRFAGFVNDVASIWNDHHGLVLASRAEGLPLVLVEAMLSGRVPIVTNVAGSGEVVRDGVSGFLASSPTDESVDEALERAWNRRAEWQSIGNAASDHIRTLVSPDPAQTFATTLLRLVNAGTEQAFDENAVVGAES